MSRYTAREAAEKAEVDPGFAARLWVALGFAFAESGEAMFTDDDVEALRYAGELVKSGSVEPELMVQLTRTMASSVARIADAQVEVAVDRASRFGTDEPFLVDPVVAERTPWLLGYMWRRHANAALQRVLASVGDTELAMTVGFADLVGFTAMSQELDEEELASLVNRFESLAHEVVVLRGGRVVKMIGDEVMFAVTDSRAGVEIALSLAEAYSNDEVMHDVRVGLATGSVLQLQGDLYGPAVNLASRIVGIARPRSVVVSDSVHDQLAGDPAFDWRSLRPRTFKGIGRVPIWRVRHTAPPS